jgi:hypothetical protein
MDERFVVVALWVRDLERSAAGCTRAPHRPHQARRGNVAAFARRL